MNDRMTHPFGEVSCEREVRLYRDEYQEYYFNEAPFNDASLDIERYLVVGRRGTGKSSLSQYFYFQNRLQNAECISIGSPDTYSIVLEKIASLAASTSELAIPMIAKIWRFLIWSVIFDYLKHDHRRIKSASLFNAQNKAPGHILKETIQHLLSKYTGSQYLINTLDDYLSEVFNKEAELEVIKIARKRPIIISFDSLERYDVNNDPMMWAIAALVQCASDFNDDYSHRGIHVKIFITGEIFPYLRNQVILNLSKYVREPVYLHWRPKDLVKLVCWRFNLYLQKYFQPYSCTDSLDWSSFPEILENMWTPYFSHTLKNSCGIEEKSFPYVLRHTQMRPRQLIIICNRIAQIAHTENSFPRFSESAIRAGIKKTERDLAEEVFNSYSKSYQNLSKIIGALEGIPLMFKGKHLDKLAPTTASSWPKGEYSRARFHQLVTELGIVGRVRSYDDRTKIVEADYEYAMEDTLHILPNEEYVIHPMFFNKLAITEQNHRIVLPFPDHPHFRELV